MVSGSFLDGESSLGHHSTQWEFYLRGVRSCGVAGS